MTKDEMRQVWNFMAQFRPKDRRLTDKELMTAWWLTFEPYEAEALKKALADHFRAKPFWPDIDEVTALLPPLPAALRSIQPDATKPGYNPGQTPHGHDPQVDSFYGEIERLRALRREAGIPATITEARAQGLTCWQWWDLCESHGLNIADDWRPREEVS